MQQKLPNDNFLQRRFAQYIKNLKTIPYVFPTHLRQEFSTS